MSLGQQLKKFRELKSLSQEDIAQKIGVTRQAVYKWENDKSYPDIDNLILLSELYNVTLDDLIKGNESFKKKIIIADNKDTGLYVGFVIMFIGLFINAGSISALITILGVLTMVFYDDFKKIIKSIFSWWDSQKLS
ncbi:helix-turn-helix transcriptional regulator [Brevibacillus laterosporus]|uniref:helix-turn-helix domain-containing protein n=1 Tax=Brevibacillus laterosporus TaxID=1465 RepID=UPI0003792506|nr:helix-turn-helix transcriptional regulator [Brevibacillus laterosporus]ATO47827.1 transcriptional regulator [Brevibacillus laterosporus DSM 25]MBG9804971.1 transcriptional regulator [Brevibacillus laterosporus]MED2002105.1 helix-turn-helix transcriptional regulator [Brevibacillus laterosporus]MED4764988.1 helix-turn-helix transcriptional regulator [Brevibacillus laterosporus]TPH10047.1 XRE family transcriptional regulator [Brevibacillus laterosporus]